MTTNSPIRLADNWYTAEDQNIDWVIDDGTEAKTPVAIAGWTIQFRMGATPTGASVLTKTATITASSTCRVQVLSADTSGLPPKKYLYTLSRTDSGFNQVLANGDAWLQARIA